MNILLITSLGLIFIFTVLIVIKLPTTLKYTHNNILHANKIIIPTPVPTIEPTTTRVR